MSNDEMDNLMPVPTTGQFDTLKDRIRFDKLYQMHWYHVYDLLVSRKIKLNIKIIAVRHPDILINILVIDMGPAADKLISKYTNPINSIPSW